MGLRPFILTSGRVRADDPSIELETQVTARMIQPGMPVPTHRLSPEMQAIVALCTQPTSVAEIAARIRLHLGVARVLVSDLRGAGYIDVHTEDISRSHSPDLILRVIRGLSAIT